MRGLSLEIAPGDLCRAFIHDDPELVAVAVSEWFQSDPDEAVKAAQWLDRLSEALHELGRGAS